VKGCDFDEIGVFSNEEAREYRYEIKECENERAVDSCDFDYINNMDGSDKFQYRTGINVCESESVPEKNDPNANVLIESEIVLIDLPVVTQPDLESEVQMPTNVPEYAPVMRRDEIIVEAKKLDPIADIQEASPFEATTTKLEMTEEEINTLVSERVAEIVKKSTDSEPIKKLGLFAKVWRFLTSWF
jgi:hypothetical protein